MLDDVLHMQYAGTMPVRKIDPQILTEQEAMRAEGLDPYNQADRDGYYEYIALKRSEIALPGVSIVNVETSTNESTDL